MQKGQGPIGNDFRDRKIIARSVLLSIFASLLVFACSDTKQPATNSYYAETFPPSIQEFRWSNGQMPKHLDPARAASAPETDIIRAIYEGLTEIDPATLKAIPAAAESWEHSEDLKTWTFTIRENAKWSNGEPVTAFDFANSFNRLAKLEDRNVNAHYLLRNFAGVGKELDRQSTLRSGTDDLGSRAVKGQSNNNTAIVPATNLKAASNSNTANATPDKSHSGFWAEDERIFKIRLSSPDKDLPRLVAHTIFRPVFGKADPVSRNSISEQTVTNGPFRLTSVDDSGLILEKAQNYWNQGAVTLDRVRFVPAMKGEDALRAYQRGELDAITNAGFEPLALKLLEPFEDFRRSTFAALNYYRVNADRPPFSDRRVRQALAMAIERERLTEGELAGSTQPAFSLLSFPTGSRTKIAQDKDRARELLEDSGYPNGDGFPVIRLVINRNDTQQRVARSVARMWKQNLNLETEIIVKESEEMNAALESGEFDLIRRGVVLPTADEHVGLQMIFEGREKMQPDTLQSSRNRLPVASTEFNSNLSLPTNTGNSVNEARMKLTEEIAIYELYAIPLYFPTSYSLIKPYVLGFDMNVLDAPLLQNVRIDNNWQPKGRRIES